LNNDAHKKLRQKADDTLRSISDNYRNALLKKIGEEKKLEKQAIDLGIPNKLQYIGSALTSTSRYSTR